MTTSARSTSSRSTSSRKISVSRRSNGPANTSRSSSRSIRRTGLRLLPRPDRTHAHRFAHVRQRARGYFASLGGSFLQHLLQLGLIRAQLRVALPHGRQVGDDGVRHRLLEGAVPLAVEFPLDLL